MAVSSSLALLRLPPRDLDRVCPDFGRIRPSSLGLALSGGGVLVPTAYRAYMAALPRWLNFWCWAGRPLETSTAPGLGLRAWRTHCALRLGGPGRELWAHHRVGRCAGTSPLARLPCNLLSALRAGHRLCSCRGGAGMDAPPPPWRGLVGSVGVWTRPRPRGGDLRCVVLTAVT